MRLGRLADEVHTVALHCRQPLPCAPVLLAQVWIEGHRQPEPLPHDLRRLARTGEIARIDRLEAPCRELAGELLRLPPAVVTEGPVGLSLQPAVGVPVGLAVANEQQGGHDCLR
jgi:hypothetical protein